MIRFRSAASLLPHPGSSRSTTGSWPRSSRSGSSGPWFSPAPDVRNLLLPSRLLAHSVHIPRRHNVSSMSTNECVSIWSWSVCVEKVSRFTSIDQLFADQGHFSLQGGVKETAAALWWMDQQQNQNHVT